MDEFGIEKSVCVCLDGLNVVFECSGFDIVILFIFRIFLKKNFIAETECWNSK